MKNQKPLQTRRGFLKAGAMLSAAALLSPQSLLASPFNLPVGLQLYSVRDLLPKDYDGTLKQLAALGYKEVEAAGFYDRTAQQVKSSMQAAGLTCVSAHYALLKLQPNVDEIIAFHNELGAHYLICSSPSVKDPAAPKTMVDGHPALSMDDWHWNAEQFNKLGEKVKAAGLQFGYHNHTPEFRKINGVTPYDELLRLTDPRLVTFEMDCGWVTVGGGNPIDYLQHHAKRISMLHVKDFQHSDHPASSAEPPKSAELGRGTTDFKAIFKAANKSHIKHYFVEQEEYDMPPYEALKIDADYMKNLAV